jgi:hypothetical protein
LCCLFSRFRYFLLQFSYKNILLIWKVKLSHCFSERHATKSCEKVKVKLFHALSNQQDATIFVHWSFYWSIWICVSSDKLAYLQEHIWLYIQLRYNTPIFLPTGDKVEVEQSSISSLSPVGSNSGALHRSCIYSQMCSWRWTSLSPETGRTDSNRWIKRSLNENCCILLVAYIVVLMMHGLTNVKLYGCRMWLGLNRGHFTTDKVAVAPIPWTCVFSWYWGTTFHEYDNTKTIID